MREVCAGISITTRHQVVLKWEGSRSRKQEANVWIRGRLPCPLLSRGEFQVGEQQAQSVCVCQLWITVHTLLFDCKTFPISVVNEYTIA